jgi:GNAT superfamily N-acetyltransferase
MSERPEASMIAIREATEQDAPLIVTMIHELAEFAHALEQVHITADDVLRDGFGPSPHFHTLLAGWDGKPAAFALYFFTYSTWAARPSLYVEDLFVRGEFRGKGIGKALMLRMAALARERHCQGMRWEVLNWNTPAIDFYRSLGAEVLSDWLPVRFIGNAFDEFAAK